MSTTNVAAPMTDAELDQLSINTIRTLSIDAVGRLAGSWSTSVRSRSELSLSDCLRSESATVDGGSVWHDGCPNVWS
jgi:hypothetical protein